MLVNTGMSIMPHHIIDRKGFRIRVGKKLEQKRYPSSMSNVDDVKKTTTKKIK